MNINMKTVKSKFLHRALLVNAYKQGRLSQGGGAISHIFKSGGLKAWLFQLGKGKGKCIYIAHFL